MQQQPVQILLVDDADRYHSLYEHAITETIAAKVSFAVDGKRALELIDDPRSHFDLIILDLNIPFIHGDKVLLSIRNNPRYHHVPIMILTGEADSGTHIRLLEMGADDFVEKGAAPEVLVARIKTQVRHKTSLDNMTRLAVDMEAFSTGVLHDIRNIETTVLALCQILKSQIETDPVNNKASILSDLQKLEDQALRMSEYAANIIQRSKEAHKPLQLISIDLEKLISDAGQLVLANRQGQGRAGGRSTLKIGTPLRPVLGDEHLLRLALVNILQNSLKYARHGVPAQITITQEAIPQLEKSLTMAGNQVLTKITDNGQGVSKQELRKIFQPFTKGSNSGYTDGYGLGLSLVRKVINNMGGQVWAELPESGEPGLAICLQLAEGGKDAGPKPT